MDRRDFLLGSAAGAFAVTLNWPLDALAQDGDALLSRFQAPGPDARPHSWWHWMNGNVTRDGITRDLEALARVGVGGVQMFDVGCGIPPGPVATLSPEWVRLVRHAADECGRLGLHFTVHNCPGWSSSGGPWITPALAMQQLVWSEVTLAGGKPVDRLLPQPFTRLDHYRDALTIAFPALLGDRAAARGQIARASLNGAATDVRVITDGNAATILDITPGATPSQLVVEFARPYRARSLTIQAGPVDDNANFSAQLAFQVEASTDGERWHLLGEAPVPVWRLHTTPPIVINFLATSARFFRLSLPATCRLSELTLSSDPRIADVGAKAGWGRRPNTGETPGPAEPAATIDPATVIDLTDKVDRDGRLRWTAPPGEWTVLRFGHTATGARNLSYPDAGGGLECDKFSAAALDFHFEKYFGELLPTLERLGKRELAGALIDSYETGMQNWTGDFPRAFEARRGYALTRYMPAVTGRTVGTPEITERFLWDLRRVHATLMEDRYFGRFHALCKQHGLHSYTEPYGNGAFDDQQAGARVDALMGEFWVRGGAAAYSIKVAATTAHVHGKRFVGAESFTGRPAQSRWLEYPYAMKALGDEMYCYGLNHFVFHRYAQQPHPTARPGMTMGPWGFHFERTNTWFEEAGPWLAYAARCQYLLAQGNFVADLLYFAGENSPVQCPVHIEEPVAATLSGARPKLAQPVPPGYDYDVCDADVLHRRTRIEDGRIVLPDGVRYRVLVMPEDRRITRETLQRIHDLVRQGMWLVGARVEQSHGLAGYPESDRAVQELAGALWGDLDGRTRTARSVGKGRVFWGVPLDTVLAEAKLPPDVELSAQTGDAALHWIHRRIDGAEVYFISNARRRAEQIVATFRVAGRMPECWDPMTGRSHPLPVHQEADGRTRVALRLDEAGSCFIVFRKAAADAGASDLTGPGGALLSTRAAPARPRQEAAGRFSVTAWIKPETDLWPISPEIASDSESPDVVAARVNAIARGASLERLGAGGASFLVDPPAGADLFGAGHATLGISAGRNGVILYHNAGPTYRAALTAQVPIAGWTHIAATCDDDGSRLYLNGAPVARGDPAKVTLHAVLGATIARPRLFEGDVADLALHHTALGEAAIAALAAQPLPSPPTPPDAELAPAGLLVWQGGRYRLGTRDIHVEALPPPHVIEGPWQVAFPPDLGAPPRIMLDRLASLHRHADPGVRHFSGTAAYRTRFTVSSGAVGGDRRLYLDLGRVEVIARVSVNGKRLGSVWKPPHRIDVTDAVRIGDNRLEVQVTNLWPNRLIGDEQLPPEHDYSVNAFGWDGGIAALPEWYRTGQPKPPGKRIAFTTWRHYAADSPLLESGLLGPVRLLGARLIPIGYT